MGQEHADLTVVSTLPPAEVGAATATLDPRQLGQALEGQQLDHVLLEKFVGGGGMGAVFRAWDTNLHRTVAVKVLSMRQAGDVESQRRFQIEARSAAPHWPGRATGIATNARQVKVRRVTIVALLADVLYRVAIRSHVRRAIGI